MTVLGFLSAFFDGPPLRSPQVGDVFLCFLAFFCPSLAVLFKGGCSTDFWINICLSILGWLPGVIHAWYIISIYETRVATVTYVLTVGKKVVELDMDEVEVLLQQRKEKMVKDVRIRL
ncbi:hypothetical protein QBC46DRAFT_390661 [Diplogelasinospora grovesii]|uniref:Uncharacterized protein n=1 Tax=Diplogelasinospora grovesii TaxID=303347 RepID=A0AAN6S385_9PEZI|nr:hypothetical protein QBC46DRAFT_390661 [Diplogelasinospora grovesii]